MSTKQTILLWIAVIVGIVILAFALEALDVLSFGLFEPKREEIRREIFEETKSYVHGVIQDLGKYYNEWQNAETQDNKEKIENVVKMRFPEFDASKIKSNPLRLWFENARGY